MSNKLVKNEELVEKKDLAVANTEDGEVVEDEKKTLFEKVGDFCSKHDLKGKAKMIGKGAVVAALGAMSFAAGRAYESSRSNDDYPSNEEDYASTIASSKNSKE